MMRIIRPVAVRAVAIVINKSAKIKKNPHRNEWTVYSEKGRRMGTYSSLSEAKERLRKIEFFKHLKNDDIIEPEFHGDPPDFLDVEVKQASNRFQMLVKILKDIR